MTVLPRDSERDVPVDATAAAEYFFAGAVDAGLAHVVISPGSRSTALAIAATRSAGLEYSIELDERVAAFTALGYAKATGAPVALVCTSGTAAANYLPALSEASMSDLPILAITADRPPEHRGWGVGQSFDQRGLYLRQVREEISMPVGGDGGAQFSLRAGWRAAITARDKRGPVHVNWPFRLPLEPAAQSIRRPTPLTHSLQPTHGDADAVALDASVLASLLDAASSPVIVAGPDAVSGDDGAAVMATAEQLRIPVLADVLSGMPPSSARVKHPGLLVSSAAVPEADVVVRLGDTPTAKSLRLWWERSGADLVVVDPAGRWHDPSHLGGTRLTSSTGPLFAQLASLATSKSPDLFERWASLGNSVDAAVDGVLTGWPTVTEAHVAHRLGELAGSEDIIIASSSMPVRDLDTFASETSARVLSNRGINGIDGVVSTASGVRMAHDGGHVYVLLGDVAAIHDIGGILSAARERRPLRIVVPNNDGGGIFSQLPIRDALDDAVFNELFHTPHGTTLAFLAGYPGIAYRETTDVRTALIDTAGHQGPVVIEVPVDTPERLELAAAIHAAIGELKP